MSDTPAPAADERPRFPECPSCGKLVTSVTVRGPTEGMAHPCGCRLWPGTLEHPRLE